MLLNHFFTIGDKQVSGNELTVTLTINKDHSIFEGHFPGQPVVPGVCMMQMILELMEQVTGKRLKLITAHDMKFLAVINPQVNNSVSATVKYTEDEGGTFSASATIFCNETVHFRFKGQFGFL